MTKLDEIFTAPTSDLHPRARLWKESLEVPGTSATLELDRMDTGLGQLRSGMHVHFVRNGEPLFTDSLLWNDDLNADLIHEMPVPVRAASEGQEAERFSLGLDAALRTAALDFGDGLLNSVLVDYFADSDLPENPRLADTLRDVRALDANREAKSYLICREMVAGAIGGRARELTGSLGYSREEAKQILVSAIALYLDDRFSITRRRRMGLI